MMLYFAIKYNLIRALLYLFVLPKRGSGVEIGVWKGWNAKMLYYLTNPYKLYLIDPYESELCDDVYQPVRLQEEMNIMWERVDIWTKDKLVYLLRDTSENMVDTFFTIDWIYIDGNHFDVYNDLTRWYPHIKKGGIIMGDDYGNKGYPKVKEDVDRFCKERGIKLHTFHFQYWFKK